MNEERKKLKKGFDSHVGCNHRPSSNLTCIQPIVFERDFSAVPFPFSLVSGLIKFLFFFFLQLHMAGDHWSLNTDRLWKRTRGQKLKLDGALGFSRFHSSQTLETRAERD